MASPTLVHRPKPETFDIDELVSLALRGRLRVPRFQRSFVWTADDVRKLFDSIWRGFPIGTLLLWKRPDAPEERVAFGPFEIDAPAMPEAYSVVDGQQRLSALVGVLAAEAADVDPIFDVSFDLRTARFVHGGRPPLPSWFLPLRVALDSVRLLPWQRERADELDPDELAVADEFVRALRRYEVPAYLVEYDDDELLRELFDRVNSSGKPISRAQMFHALWGGNTGAASTASVVTSLRRERFGQLDEQRVMQSLLAVRGGDVQRDLHDEFAPNEDRQPWFDDTERALARAIEFLRAQGVPHLLLTPTTLPIPVLAAFFHLHPRPDPWNERLLGRWLWRGWVHGFGSAGQGQTPALRRAVRAVNPFKGAPDQAPAEHDAVRLLLDSVPDEPAPVLFSEQIRTNSAEGRLALLALASVGPRGPDGEPLDVAAELELRGVDAISEVVPGHRSLLAARAFLPDDRSAGKSSGAGPDVQASQVISDEAVRALMKDGVEGFLAVRSRDLRELQHAFLTARLDTGAPVRPPLADLYVPDEPLEAFG